MTGVMDDIDTDAVFSDMVLRLAAGMDAAHRRTTAPATAADSWRPDSVAALTCETRAGYCGSSCLAA